MLKFNTEEMEMLANQINHNRKVFEDNTKEIVDGIKAHCFNVKKEVEGELTKIVDFINRHSNMFYKYNPSAKYATDRVQSKNCRNWREDDTSVYIGNIEIKVNPQTGKAVSVSLNLDYQYNNKVCSHRPHSHSKSLVPTARDIDYWTEAKIGMDELRDDLSHIVKEFARVMNNLNNHEINRFQKLNKCCNEIDNESNDSTESIVIVVRKVGI